MGGKKNAEYKMHRKPSWTILLHTACWELHAHCCHLTQHVRQFLQARLTDERLGAVKVFLTGQNLSGYREIELVRQRAHEIQQTLVKERLFSKFIRCCSFMVISASSVQNGCFISYLITHMKNVTKFSCFKSHF